MYWKKKVAHLSVLLSTILFSAAFGQHHLSEKYYTDLAHADSLRGNIEAPERTWWDIQRYDVTVKPEFEKKFISGTSKITYKVVKNSYPAFMQIDLQAPMQLDSVLFNGKRKLNFKREGNAFQVNVPKQIKSSEAFVQVYFHGKPTIAKKAPWDGGWIFAKDSLGRPWMTVACQGLGASVWYPCKDVQDDEPDKGASLTMIVPDTLTAVSNGRKVEEKRWDNGWKSVKWQVVNPINNYTLVPYIGKYVEIKDHYNGLEGNLDIGLWALDYNRARMVEHCQPDVLRMLKAFEYWFGAYPFYEDSYKLVDAPYLGMEHQSAVAYGNHYLNGYAGRDLSGTGIGLNWDFVVVHESGHEWFANNITSKDIADMWIHESFTNYSEVLFTEYYYGRQAGQEYCFGIRKNISNDKPIVGPYGVNREGSGDMYYKGANMLNSIRNAMGNDDKFRAMLVNINKTFYHKTVTYNDIEELMSKESGIELSAILDQYLKTTQVPQLEYAFSNDKRKLYFRYVNCEEGFDLPLNIRAEKGAANLLLKPTVEWQSISLNSSQARLMIPTNIEFQYYLTTKKVDVPAI